MNATSEHAHCDLGLFHSAGPLHTHAHCKNCYHMRRCEGRDTKMLRCTGCYLSTYCSKECQKAHWRDGHKQVCKMFSVHKGRAASISGNPNAWQHLATFIEYHHATLINCTLACYLRAKPEIPNVASSHFLLISLLYRNDPTRRPQDQFEVRGMHLEDRNDPSQPPTFKILMTDRAAAIEMGKKEFGNDYWGTGAYVLMVKFAPSPLVGALPFWKHFGIDKEHARATPACTHPWDQLRENIHEGKRQKFCCGRVEGLPTCCCGGWTHEQGAAS